MNYIRNNIEEIGMIKELFNKKRPDKNKYDKKIKLECDKCKVDYEMFFSAFKKSQTRHIGKHLCLKCSNAREYKKIITGEDNKKFNGGISPNGYRRIYYDGKNTFEHRIMASKKIGRKLEKGENVHHINGNKLENSFENLYIFKNNKDHKKCHYLMERLAFDLLKRNIWFNCKSGEYQIESCEDFVPKSLYGELKDDVNSVDGQNKKNKLDGRYLCKFGTNRSLHIFLIEKLINRKLYRDEVVHHINGDINDNSIKNLFLTDRRQHKKMHESMSRCICLLYKIGIVGFNDGLYFLKREEDRI